MVMKRKGVVISLSPSNINDIVKLTLNIYIYIYVYLYSSFHYVHWFVGAFQTLDI